MDFCLEITSTVVGTIALPLRIQILLSYNLDCEVNPN